MALTRSSSQHSIQAVSSETPSQTQYVRSRSPSRDIEEILYGSTVVVEDPDETIIATQVDNGTGPTPVENSAQQQYVGQAPSRVLPPSIASLDPPFTGYVSAEQIEFLGNVADHKSILVQQIHIWSAYVRSLGPNHDAAVVQTAMTHLTKLHYFLEEREHAQQDHERWMQLVGAYNNARQRRPTL